ncbi:MAG: pullulanase-type alpha-1,6-glucosidase [Alteromonadaceae bacterium]|nr:pullulanase-type alpha-1,6-glucosidase [Alteromonadaceae bacterium]
MKNIVVKKVSKTIRKIPTLFFTLVVIAVLGACEQKQISEIPVSVDQLALLPDNYSAHWLEPKLLLLPKKATDSQTKSYKLVNVTQNKKLESSPVLTQTDTPAWLKQKHPHLADFQAFAVSLSDAQAKLWLKQQLMVVEFNSATSAQASDEQLQSLSQPKAITYVQTANVLDYLYTRGGNDADEHDDFGAVVLNDKVNFKLWSPTATKVTLRLFNQDISGAVPATIVMSEDINTGIWSASTGLDNSSAYYQYQIELYHPASKNFEKLITTDPYSLSLSANSEYSQVIDLNSAATKPAGWQAQKDIIVGKPENNIFYETHIRDFSAHDPKLSNPLHRGKYKAFSEQNSAGVTHLKALQQAGINNIHLLPAFDIGTVNESKAIDLNDKISKACLLSPDNMLCSNSIDASQTIRTYLTKLPKGDEQRQAVVSSLRTIDNYNWGYDPFHYTVPEGSYALNPEGVSRIIEFREMVQSIHNLGFRVIMDVVYNHTHQASLEPTAVLDKIVPNYYHRLDPVTGAIAQSTCCDNTATEQVMMEKLMIDSLVVWARDYKIDGFRFDLMAHQPKSAMLKAREVVRQVDADTYFYGEGWNFGEVADNQRFIQASQLELAGTEIGTFTDRMRDAVRGGAFTASGKGIRKSQGIGNGLGTAPNDLNAEDGDLKSQQEYSKHYTLLMDQLRIGLAGNLADFPIENAQSEQVTGKDIPYGNQPTGYALDPADTINYISKHDNQTLWDNNQYRIAYHTSTQDRVRMQLQNLSFPLLAQGIPFIHMGSELLRSKSFLRDSYDYGDWFNKVDFTMTDNNYNVGLPPADKDQANWSMIKEVLDKNEGRDHVTPSDIRYSNAVFIEFIKIRMSTPLFRLTTADSIINQIKFHNTGKNQQTGLIVMSIEQAKPITSNNEINKLVVIFNTSTESKQIPFTSATQYSLHTVQLSGADKVVKNSKISEHGFTVPALTTAVFVAK